MNQPTAPASEPVSDQPQKPEKPAKPPRLLRPAALWLLPLTVLVLLALVPLALEPYLEAKLRDAAHLAGLEFAPETTISVSVFSGRISLRKVDLREYVDGKPRSLFTADEAELDAAVLACLGGDIVFDRVAVTGARGDLRRRGDGSIPLATPPPEAAEGAGSSGTGWGKLDWWSYARKAYEWHSGKTDKPDAPSGKTGSATAPAATPEQPAPAKAAEPPEGKPAHDWSGARTYTPAPGPAGPATLVLIRVLTISGSDLQLPDDTPFSVTSFAIDGRNLSWGRASADDWSLNAKGGTRGAGAFDLAVERTSGQVHARFAADALPLEALAHPALAGEAISRHGASGTAKLVAEVRLDAKFAGTVQAHIEGLRLQPTQPSAREAQIAQVVNRLKGKPIDWTIRLGGTPQDPQVTDDGLEALLKGSLGDAAKEALIEEGTKRLGEELDKNPKLKELKNDEKVKKATDKAAELLKGLGK